MLICFNCKEQLLCTKTHTAAEFHRNQIYKGSLYKCPKCNYMVLKTAGSLLYDPEHKLQNSYVNMVKE